ncbi:flagellar motor switch protein FliN/FliY [Halomonas campaniensis]|jgi:flagellar motor switch protein FliN|uniref:Flagellar motor switch protein FliN n=1 Tax=Halomonas campaniensis TaxID=213554 RepID=A0A7W5P9S3_9GAMM|nr:flagellar motor switch protein FliN [Halomonas campaniensis]MBB3329918.1 flagellar motor switch protein FliN/FliY [Halomonas campaniensis]
MTDPKKPDQPIGDDDWADAMFEQEKADSRGDAPGEEEDPWAAAMAEQAAAESADAAPEPAEAPKPARAAGDSVFRPLEQGGSLSAARDLEMIMDIPVKLAVELGRTRITIKQLLELAQGSVIELDGLAGEPMDILINGYLIAQGEVVVVEDKYGIRITEIITPSERVQKLNR